MDNTHITPEIEEQLWNIAEEYGKKMEATANQFTKLQLMMGMYKELYRLGYQAGYHTGNGENILSSVNNEPQ